MSSIKIGRNDPCPCGSSRKYKKCHLNSQHLPPQQSSITQRSIKERNIILLNAIVDIFGSKKGRVTNWIYVRKQVGETAERLIFKTAKRRPLVLPVVIEV